MNENNIKTKAVSGIMWTAIQKYSTMIATFIAGIVLARLLTPEDYGCVGMLSIFMMLAGSMLDAGFGSALIQKKKPSQEDYSTIFFWNIGMSILLYAVLYFCAPLIALFYHIPLLSILLRVQAMTIIIGSLTMVQYNVMKKQLRFRELSIIAISSSLISTIACIIFAFCDWGVWSLVAQGLVAALVNLILFWSLSSWRPSLVFSRQSFRSLFSFGIFVFLSRTLSDASKELHSLLIGRFYNPSTLGYFSKARSMERMSALSISSVITGVTYPFYAQVQDDFPAMRGMIKRFVMSIAYITFPLMMLLMLVAKPLFVFLYSDRWIESVPFFQVLCLGGPFMCIQSVSTQTIAAIGKSKVMFEWRLVKLVVSISLLFVGLFTFGIWGILIASVLTTFSYYIINSYLVSKHIGYSMWNQFSILLPIIFLTTVATIIPYIVGSLLSFGMYVTGIIQLVLFAVIYVTGSYFFRLEAFKYFKTLLPIVLSKIRKK